MSQREEAERLLDQLLDTQALMASLVTREIRDDRFVAAWNERLALRTALMDLLAPEPQPDPGFHRMVPTGTRAERVGTK